MTAYGVVLDIGSSLGRMANNCISMAVSDFYSINRHYKTRLILHTRDSMGDPLYALSSGYAHSYLFCDHSFLSRRKLHTLSVWQSMIKLGKSYCCNCSSIRMEAVTLIHEDSNYGNGVIPYLIGAFEEIDSRVPHRSVISPRATDNQITIEVCRIITDGITSILNSMDPLTISREIEKQISQGQSRPILNELNIFSRKSQPEKLKSLSKFTNLASISDHKPLKDSQSFSLKDGQLELAFQLVNVVGNGVKGIGFWTPKHGISRELNLGYPFNIYEQSSTYHPARTICYPKRCVQGAVENLPYALTYEFIPFDNSNGSSALTYTDLVFQVYLQVFDAVVGDVTITSNRSLYVDFTLPYTELGVGMVWCFFILTGCIVWLIERKINDEFKGSRAQQVGMIFLYSFSTSVFSQSNNLSKFVVIVWFNANVNRLQMLQKGSFIGYQKGSLAREVVNNLNFANSSLQTYGSIEAYAHALTEGSKKGGVSAIIDEIPYIKLFLAQYGDQYTMIEPEYLTTNGFGFLREDGKLDMIQQTWFQDQSICKKQESPTKPSILDSYSFRGLFLVTGTSSTLALIIFYVFQIRNKLTNISDHPTDNNISTEGEENLSNTNNGNQPS
ncbi:hypothetical protein AAG906_020377 [Vitis piasezkii]